MGGIRTTNGRRALSRVGAGALVLSVALTLGQTLFAIVASASNSEVCTGEKYDVGDLPVTTTDGIRISLVGSDSVHFDLPDGVASAVVCVKAGSAQQGDGPVNHTITADQTIGTGGKEVSHVSVVSVSTPTTPPPTTPPPTTPPPTTPPPTTPPPGELGVDIVKSNDADGDGVYTNAEEAPEEGSNVSFRVVITNTSDEAVTIAALTDSFPGRTVDLLANKCSQLAGATLAAGGSASCTFAIHGYSPPAADPATVNTASVCVSGSDERQACDEDASRVTSAEVLGETITRGPTKAPPGGTAFTGSGDAVGWILAAGLLVIGTFLLYVTAPRGQDAPA